MLVKFLLDFCAADAGSMALFGTPSDEPRARARLAYVPERFLPPHYLRGREFLEFTASLGGVAYREAAARALLAELELDLEVLSAPCASSPMAPRRNSALRGASCSSASSTCSTSR